ncbi:hypothetical protein AAFC00_002881 [Neodothiora populina]|uniref:Nucleolar protein 12 n=1 Tax=Neodothiora populina TaxID=2781224 RepID=A0ABR3P8U1_9PEZI
MSKSSAATMSKSSAATMSKSSADKSSTKDKKSSKPEHTSKKSKKDSTKSDSAQTASSTFASAVGPAAFDTTISSLFANSLGPSKPNEPVRTNRDVEEEDEELEELEDEDGEDDSEDMDVDAKSSAPAAVENDDDNKRKRKRKDKHDDLEDVYMERLARDEAKALAKQKQERASKRVKKTDGDDEEDEDESEASSDAASDDDQDAEDAGTPPPVHESLLPDMNTDLAKSQRTVFLGNVSSEAITSKTAEKTLRRHLSSFFSALDAPAKDQPAHSIESIRFRSTAFASAIPKKAAFAKKELMEATTKSTNAYLVYSSAVLAREAARRLNGSVVLDRHLRVDEVAHPAKVDHKRCIFVGNLGFVDDESNIDKANEEQGIQKRQGKKTPSDVEEGLWRTFATCGTVESVRVVRDSKTRVGKGFAYVQFTDENAVEAALLLNEKKFPPMLPRKLRVTRAKAIKRNAKSNNANATRPPQHTQQPRSSRAGGVYNPKMSSQEQSNLGRAGKLLGRAAAAQLRNGDGSVIKAPEKFVFEGHRASSSQGKNGFKFGKKGKPGSKSSTKRAAAWKAKGK